MPGQPEFQQRLQSIERLLSEVEAAADPNLRTSVQEIVQLVVELHGAGIERMLDLVRASGEGEALVHKMGRDELVASLLVLHGLHPISLDARVTEAVEKVRLKLRVHDGELDIVSIQEGAVHLRLRANGQGCGSSAQALKEMVEEAVYRVAPDVASLSIEDAGNQQGFVSLTMLQGSASAPLISNSLSLKAEEKGAL